MIRVAAQSGTALRLKSGQRLKVICPEGAQVADFFCFTDDSEADCLSSGRSIDYAETIFFTRGHTLYSYGGKPLLRLTEDTCGTHDFLVTPCSLQMFQMMGKNSSYHPSCQENLEKALGPHGVDVRRIGTTFNIFMNVKVEPGGRIEVKTPLAKPGDFVVLEALHDLIVGLTACSDEGSNGGSCKSIAYEILA